jgi:uncharacterized protein (DUF2461 family)
MAADQLARFRTAVDAEATGAEVARLAADATKRGYRILAISELKSAPRGFSKDHPRIELLRRKGLIAVQEFGSPAWMYGKTVPKRIRQSWAGVADLCGWLDAHVGPSTLPPDDRPF